MPNVQLEASLDGTKVCIRDVSGNSAPHLQRNAGPEVFTFNLTDNTGLGVEFCTVEEGLVIAEDDSTDCPPNQHQTTQIDCVRRPNGRTASFRDKNDNQQEDMPVSYQLNFKCSGDPQRPVFDPTITNGGHT